MISLKDTDIELFLFCDVRFIVVYFMDFDCFICWIVLFVFYSPTSSVALWLPFLINLS